MVPFAVHSLEKLDRHFYGQIYYFVLSSREKLDESVVRLALGNLNKLKQ